MKNSCEITDNNKGKEKDVRIIQLTASNVKRLKAIDITPEGDIVEIAGRNDQGKTSVLDSIWWALGGKRAIQRSPVREGEEQAEVVIDLGDIMVKRSWDTSGDTKLKVFAANGAEQTSPQSILDNLVGRLAFDPLEFARMDARTQRDMLLRIVGLEDNLLALQVEREGLTEKRKDAGKDVKRLEMEFASLEAVPKDTPRTEVDLDGLTMELQSAMDAKGALIRQQESLKAAYVERENLQTRLNVLNHSIEEAEVLLDGKKVPDVDGIRQRMGEVQELNRLVRQRVRREEITESVKEARRRHDVLDGKIQDVDRKKEKALRAAAFPVEGLGVDFEGVTFNGLPFEQASNSQQLKVSMAVAMAMNPKLRVLRINDGSLLDMENMKLIAQMAAEYDYQVWVERVEPSSESAVIIEDGTVKGKGEQSDGRTESK
jgi:predicted  nucleic acid-binding Zn-ribbon protein